MINHIGQIPAAAALKFSNKDALVFEGKPSLSTKSMTWLKEPQVV